MQVEQRHRDAAADYAREHWLWPAPDVSNIRRGVAGWDEYHLVLAFARFEASLPPSAPVDAPKPWTMDAARELHAGMIQAARDCAGSHGAPQSEVREAGSMFLYRALLATPSVLAESTSNDCLLVAEAVRERCVEAAEKLVRFDRKNGDEQQRARADAFQAGQRHAAQEIRSLDLSGVGVG